MQLKVKKLYPEASLPTKAHSTDAGFDLYSLEDVCLWEKRPVLLSTGIAIEIPDSHYGQILGRSSLNKIGLICYPGVIDSGYRGEVKVMMQPTFGQYTVKKGQRIAQLLILPVPSIQIIETNELSATERGEGGFGSTGSV